MLPLVGMMGGLETVAETEGDSVVATAIVLIEDAGDVVVSASCALRDKVEEATAAVVVPLS